jgi:hypothetical protein
VALRGRGASLQLEKVRFAILFNQSRFDCDATCAPSLGGWRGWDAGVDVFGLGAEMRMLARTAKLHNKLPEDLEQMLAADARAGVAEAMRKSAAQQGIDEIVITHEHLQVSH